MKTEELYAYWNSIPIGEENAMSREILSANWGMTERKCRSVMREMSKIRDGGLVLIRSSYGNGFFRTEDKTLIRRYAAEMLNRGMSCIDNAEQAVDALDGDACVLCTSINRLADARRDVCMRQADVSAELKAAGYDISVPVLSLMENGVVIPSGGALVVMANLYRRSVFDIYRTEYRPIHKLEPEGIYKLRERA